tara:strand:- start:4880 stop:5617 length:738 start_codon:yes stop_codon:yes gene_type:complete
MEMSVTEEEFLKSYDASEYERPSVTVDLVLMSVKEGQLVAMLQRRPDHPFKGQWALPGGFIALNESVDDTAKRLLLAKAQMEDCFLEQLYTFGETGRDPRTRVLSIVYFALLPLHRFESALDGRPDLMLAKLTVPWTGETGGPILASDANGETLALAFDHAEILGLAVKRLRGRLDYSPIAFALLPRRFTLRELQMVHEAILGSELNKPAFRRRILDKGWIKATGKKESGKTFRPAELYQLKQKD